MIFKPDSLRDTGWRRIRPSKFVKFGEGTEQAISTWSNGYGKVSAIEDDHEIVFIGHNTKKRAESKVSWIPPEIIVDLAMQITSKEDENERE